MLKWLSGIFSIVLILSLQAGAQNKDPEHVKWTTSVKEVSKNTYELTITAMIEKSWHVYSQYKYDTSLLAYPKSAEFSFTKAPSYTLVGNTVEMTKVKKVYDKGFETNTYLFENKAVFVQKVKILKPTSSISGRVDYQVCKDVCFQKSAKFTFLIPNADKSGKGDADSRSKPTDTPPIHGLATPDSTAKQDPDPYHHVKWAYEIKQLTEKEYELKVTGKIDKDFHLVANASSNGLNAPAIALSGGDSFRTSGTFNTEGRTINITNADGTTYPAYDNQIDFTQKIEMLKKATKVQGKVSFNLCNEKVCFPAQETDFSLEVPKGKLIVSQGNEPLSSVFWLGFIGGLFALFTPCVFPMIPLTISFFTKQSENKSKSVSKALLFGVSIIVIYVSLGLLISVIFGPQALKNLASNVYTNLLFFLVFTVFAFSFLGAFDITLPSSWANKADERAEKGGVIGIFFIALTLAIVSFSCTSPIVSELLILGANGGGYAGPTVGMMGFALAWAIPFTVFAMFPTLMQQLPKSGGWLNSVKVTLGFIELALALKFLSTADLVYNWGILKREYFLALWIIIFGMLGFYLLGKLRLSHDSQSTHISVSRLMLALLSLSFALYMLPGIWGAPVKLLSGIAPPSTYSEWIHDEGSNTVQRDPGTNQVSSESNAPHKYKELFKSPHGIQAYYDFDEAMKAAKESHKPLMIDFTGHACTNCRLMEENVWSDKTALSILKNDYVLVSLYDDDRTALSENEVYTSKVDGDKIKTIGAKWSDFEISRYQTNAMPFYVLLDNNEHVLAKSTGYDSNVDHFIAFLEKGKAGLKTSMR